MIGRKKAISRILIANRGEIATRIIHTCNDLGIESVLTVSAADQNSLPAKLATRSICIGPAMARDSYLRPELIIQAALGSECNALHPGYGFLSEQPALANLCAANDIIFIGPRTETIEQMGNKITARAIAQKCAVPLLPGSDSVEDLSAAKKVAQKIGFPVLIKAAAGGGGRGMRVVYNPADLEATLMTTASEAEAAFGDPTLFIERFIKDARHIEVQILGDASGNVIHLAERDCSLQRRYQKVIEEAPAIGVPKAILTNMREAAINIAREVSYLSVGTVEFLYDKATEEFFFLEMNTRLQVEHPVTEMVTGIDIVAEQIRINQGEEIDLSKNTPLVKGHAIEARVTAETPLKNFRPSPGKVTAWRAPKGDGIRVDTYCEKGCLIPPFYDSLVAKIIVHASSRIEAIEKLSGALQELVLEGIDTNVEFLLELLLHESFVSQNHNTHTIDEILANRPNHQLV